MSADGPWVRFFASDWLAGTAKLSAVERGAYITLVCQMYEEGAPITRNEARLARLCALPTPSFVRILDALIEMKKITVIDGKLWQRRVEIETGNRVARASKARDAANAKHQQNQSSNSASASSKHSSGGASRARVPEPDLEPEPEDHPIGDDLFRSSPTGDLIEVAFADWNDVAKRLGFPQAQRLTDARRAQLKARLKDIGGIEGWRLALGMIEESDFLMGRTNAAFRPHIDFVLQESSFTKLAEGAYRTNKRAGSPAMEALRKLREELANG